MECPQDATKCPHVVESAELAVKKVFAILGVDIDKPEAVEEFRVNLRFGASLRRSADRGWLVLVGGVAAGLLGLLGAGVVAFVHNVLTGRAP